MLGAAVCPAKEGVDIVHTYICFFEDVIIGPGVRFVSLITHWAREEGASVLSSRAFRG